jgi:dTDP-glucose 4,6-dehydratase
MTENELSERPRLLVTGGAGFIGSSFARWMLQTYPGIPLLVLDKLTYAGNLENLAPVENLPNYRFYRGDICQEEDAQAAFTLGEQTFGGPIEAVVHFAAETHVDRSIERPEAFLRANVLGTEVMLRVARQRGVKRFVLISTDEVYGALGPNDAPFTERTPLAPNNPYAASKAGGDLIARAYFETYGFPVLITRCSNNYGPYQFPEKLIPLMIANAIEEKPLPVYGDGQQIRDWIFVEDHSRGVEAALRRGRPGHVYNLGGHTELPNLELVRTLLRLLNRPESLITFVPDRPGHDRRYAMDTTKIETELGWRPVWDFARGLQTTVDWYLANPTWVERVRSGAYQDYYERMYGRRADWVQRQVAGAS